MQGNKWSWILKFFILLYVKYLTFLTHCNQQVINNTGKETTCTAESIKKEKFVIKIFFSDNGLNDF